MTGRIWGVVIQIPIIVSIWISGLTLVAISIDRVIAVSKPMMYRRIMTKRMAWLMIAIVWVLIIGGMAPALLYFSLNAEPWMVIDQVFSPLYWFPPAFNYAHATLAMMIPISI
ncbi:hypothetical protein CAPTEDRAFT_137422, partial [Capitella teleta]